MRPFAVLLAVTAFLVAFAPASPANAQTVWEECSSEAELLALAAVQRDAANAFFATKPDGGFRQYPRPEPPVADWAKSWQCDWFPQLVDIAESVTLPTKQVLAGAYSAVILELDDDRYNPNDTYASRLTAKAGELGEAAGAPPPGSAGPAGSWTEYVQLLPAWRWSSLVSPQFFSPDDPSMFSLLAGFVVDAISSLLFLLANLVWSLIRGLFWIAELISNGTWALFGRQINAVFATVADGVETFLIVALTVVLFSVIRAYIVGRKVGEAVRAIVALLVFAGLFWAVAGTSKAALDRPNTTQHQLRRGTAAWVGYSLVNVTDYLTAPFTQRIEMSDLFTESGEMVMPTSCAAYSNVLYGQAADGGAGGTLAMVSLTWEATYMASFQRAQFGQSFQGDLPGYATCHLGDELSRVPPSWRYDAMSRMFDGADTAYDADAVFFRDHTGRGKNRSQPGEAVVAAAACRYSDGAWGPAPEFAGAQQVTAQLCEDVFRSENRGRNNIGSDGWGRGERDGPAGNALNSLFGIDRDSDLSPDSEEARAFLAAISPGVASSAAQVVSGISALIGALLLAAVLGMLSIASAISGLLAVLSVGLLFPVILILLAFQSKRAKTVMRLAGSMLIVNLLVSAIMAFVLLSIQLMRGMVNSFFSGMSELSFIGELLIAFAPAVAVYVLNILAKRAGFGSLFNAGGLLNAAMLPMNMAMSMSGVKALQDMAKVDSQGNSALLRKMQNSGFKSIQQAGDKLKDQNLANYAFSALGKRANQFDEDGNPIAAKDADGNDILDEDGNPILQGGWNKLNGFARQSQSHRDWHSEQSNRDEFNAARDIARRLGLPQPQNMDDVLRLQNQDMIDTAKKNQREMKDAAETEEGLEDMEAHLQHLKGRLADPDLSDAERENIERDIAGLEEGLAAARSYVGVRGSPSASTAMKVQQDYQKYLAAKKIMQPALVADGPSGSTSTAVRDLVGNDGSPGMAAATSDPAELQRLGIAPERLPDDVLQVMAASGPGAAARFAGSDDIVATTETLRRDMAVETSARAAAMLVESGSQYTSLEAMRADRGQSDPEAMAIEQRISAEVARDRALTVSPAGQLYGRALSGDAIRQVQAEFERAHGVAAHVNARGVAAPSRTSSPLGDGSSANANAIKGAAYSAWFESYADARSNGSLTPEMSERWTALTYPESWVPGAHRGSELEIEAMVIASGFGSLEGRRVDIHEHIKELTSSGLELADAAATVTSRMQNVPDDVYQDTLRALREVEARAADTTRVQSVRERAASTHRVTVEACQEAGIRVDFTVRQDPSNPSRTLPAELDRESFTRPILDLAARAEAASAEQAGLLLQLKQLEQDGVSADGGARSEALKRQIAELQKNKAGTLRRISKSMEAALNTELAAAAISPTGTSSPAEVEEVDRAIRTLRADFERALSELAATDGSGVLASVSDHPAFQRLGKETADALTQAHRIVASWPPTTQAVAAPQPSLRQRAAAAARNLASTRTPAFPGGAAPTAPNPRSTGPNAVPWFPVT